MHVVPRPAFPTVKEVDVALVADISINDSIELLIFHLQRLLFGRRTKDRLPLMRDRFGQALYPHEHIPFGENIATAWRSTIVRSIAGFEINEMQIGKKL